MSIGYSQSASLRSSTPNNCSAVYQDLLALLLIQASPHPQNKKRHAITYSPYITSCLIIIIIFCVFRSPEYRLHQYHIKHRTAAYTEQSAFFPFMQCHDKQNGNQFRYPIMAASRNIFQAVHHQQSDHCIRQHCPQICDHSRWFFSLRKNKEGQKTCCHRSQHHYCNGNNLLCYCHRHFFLPPALATPGSLHSNSSL